MQKIYVLLRNDQQTGPYSLEEIIQFDLKPYDLIWIQGQRAGWYYPQEISALHPYLSFLPKKPIAATAPLQSQQGHSVFTSSREQLTAPKEEQSFVANPNTFLVNPVSPSLEEEIYAQFSSTPKAANAKGADSEKRNKKPALSKTGAVLSLLVVGGVFAASWLLNRQPDESINSTEPVPTEKRATELNTSAVATDNNTTNKTVFSAGTPLPKKKANPIGQSLTKNSAAKLEPAKPTTYRETVKGQTNEEPSPVQEIAEEMPSLPEAPVKAKEEKPEEKKKLRDKLFDLFRKNPEGEKPAETESGREANRRESNVNLAQMVHVRFEVPNDWMMGINGAKATLVNRSAESILEATIEVQYYDDDNQLLQKKTLRFGKVDGKGAKTISIPNHSTATKVDYSIIAVEAKPAA